MSAAEEPSSEGATPRRRGMECKMTSPAAKKKLVQARLPFKRLNPVPKQNGESKKPRVPPPAPAPRSPEPGSSDAENEQERPPLVNGRGPLDSFMTRGGCQRQHTAQPSVTIDLTEDSNSTPAPLTAPECPLAHHPSSSGPPAHDSQVEGSPAPTKPHSPAVSMETSPSDCERGGAVNGGPIAVPLEKEEEDDEEEEEEEEEEGDVSAAQASNISQETEEEEEEEEEEEKDGDGEGEEESSPENESMLSPSSSSCLSAVESSPEPASTTAPSTAPAPPEQKTRKTVEEKKVKRRSLKSEEQQQQQQQRRQQQQAEREERERQRQEARAARLKAQEEARRRREEREREKKEKREKEEKEKAEKLRAKEEQRKVKIEAKLEEKRKKEEEKRLKEEKDRIKAEKAEITRFLQKAKTQQAPKTLAAACGKFAPFEIKENMVLAPLTRVQCDEEVLERLDVFLVKPDDSLDSRRDWLHRQHRRSGPTLPRETKAASSECVVLVDGPGPAAGPDRAQCGRLKLLQFHENYRPAYWGTWSKKSQHISPRCPLRQDKDLLDYELDSDEEWEEEEPGESLSHSEGEEEEEGGEGVEAGDDDEDDDGFFVPHGYLSEGEGASEPEEATDPENQKVRARLKAREWDELQAKGKKFRVLEPVVIGCVWEGQGSEVRTLQQHAVCLLEALPRDEGGTPDASAREKRDDQILSQILPLLHGNVHSSKIIITEFQEFCRHRPPTQPLSPEPGSSSPPTRYRLKRLISDSAVYEKRPLFRRCCWYVNQEVLSRFGQEALPVPCQWSYQTQGPPATARDEAPPALPGSGGSSTTPPSAAAASPLATAGSGSSKRKSTGSISITKFMKKCADREQAEAMETDGFQADTEEDEEEPDCIIVETHRGSTRENGSGTRSENTEHMEVTTPDPAVTAAAPPPCPAPSSA
ncbi:chromatin assembly factor 1 subunit A [Amia ocellicauda]|uniref:chromatin assembly factor 1 subunit A n=1 Tax=Amia ocellicauda TaxID=2972642 RepID=UPI003464822B